MSGHFQLSDGEEPGQVCFSVGTEQWDGDISSGCRTINLNQSGRYNDIDDDDDDDEKECVMEAPANEDNELDTLLLLGQVSNNKISLFITMINILVS